MLFRWYIFIKIKISQFEAQTLMLMNYTRSIIYQANANIVQSIEQDIVPLKRMYQIIRAPKVIDNKSYKIIVENYFTCQGKSITLTL